MAAFHFVDLQSVVLGLHGDGTPTRMSREKSGD
jgi:hypothetical protein